jgi:hypothetical protein
MKVAAHPSNAPKVVIDLTNTPYYAPTLTLEEASSRERLTGAAGEDLVIVLPDYRTDRPPAPPDPTRRFGGGLGAAAVLDVGAHPIRARVRHINPLRVLAISVIAAVAMVMLTMVATFHH